MGKNKEDDILSSEERKEIKKQKFKIQRKDIEYGGPKGLEPTRYGDWEVNGRVSDF